MGSAVSGLEVEREGMRPRLSALEVIASRQVSISSGSGDLVRLTAALLENVIFESDTIGSS